MERLFYSIREGIVQHWENDVMTGKEVGLNDPGRVLEYDKEDWTRWKVKVRVSKHEKNGNIFYAWKEAHLLVCVLGEDVR